MKNIRRAIFNVDDDEMAEAALMELGNVEAIMNCYTVALQKIADDPFGDVSTLAKDAIATAGELQRMAYGESDLGTRFIIEGGEVREI